MLEVFLRALERKSLTRAAADLEISQALSSKLLKELEELLGLQLVRRNTHSLAATPAGLTLLGDARSLIDGWAHLVEIHSANRNENVTLQIVASAGLGRHVIFDIVTAYMMRNKDLSINWQLTNEDITFYKQGCDLWICLGPVSDQSLVVKPAGFLESVIVASSCHPLSQSPGAPSELNHFGAIELGTHGREAIQLSSPEGKIHCIEPNTRILTNDLATMLHATCHGLGFAIVPLVCVEEEINCGRLVSLIPGWTVEPTAVNLVYASSPYNSPLLHGLVNTLLERIPQLPGSLMRSSSDH